MNLAEVALVVDDLTSSCGGRLRGVHQLGRAVFLTLRRDGANETILIGVDRGVAAIGRLDARPEPPLRPPEFCRTLRRLLLGRRLERVGQVGGDRIVELAFAARSRDSEGDDVDGEGEGAAGAPASSAGPVRLIAELIGSRATIVVVDESDAVLAALDAPARGRYEPPARAGGAAAPADRAPRSVHEIASRYLVESLEKERATRSEALARRVGKEIARRRVILERVEHDLERAYGHERDREIGELLKGAWSELRRGLSRIELVDYWAEGTPRISVELDPALSPEENVEARFRRYRKSRRAIDHLTERHGRIEGEIEALSALEAELPRAANVDAVAALESRAARWLRSSPRGRKKRPEDAGGPRVFHGTSGAEILVGRSAKQNDQLTLRIARGNDIFLHVAGRPGAHVILRSGAGEPHPEDLLDAATLALYYSLPERSGGAFLHGASGEIDYTRVKWVSKPKGARPGAVLLASHKALRVALDPARLQRLRAGPVVERE